MRDSNLNIKDLESYKIYKRILQRLVTYFQYLAIFENEAVKVIHQSEGQVYADTNWIVYTSRYRSHLNLRNYSDTYRFL